MVRWASFLVLIAACGFPRPADVADPKSCVDGICTDPSYPFCDEGGEISGAARMCVAVSCTPGEFAACRGDVELSCNSAGATYDAIQCALGCAPAIGCRLCEPNQTVCANGKVQTCDASGAVTSSEICSLGCFEDQPRCRALDPSNNLATYADMVSTAPDLELTNVVFSTGTGKVTADNQPVVVPNFLAARSGDGEPIRVYVVNSLKLTNASIDAGTVGPSGPGLAIVARRDLVLEGTITVSSTAGRGTPGAAVIGCRPGGSGTWDPGVSSGGGGGANGTDGADGGSVVNTYPGGVKDVASGTALLVPLRGGCSGTDIVGSYQNGGGAIQFSSGATIHVDATVDARGFDGTYGFSPDNASIWAGGGGGGGSILLEAPEVVLGPTTKLLTTGGNGYSTCPSADYGAAGVGATATTPASKGADVQYAVGASAGGGGGGLGRVRINTKTGVYTKASSTVEDAVLTTGVVSTRLAQPNPDRRPAVVLPGVARRNRSSPARRYQLQVPPVAPRSRTMKPYAFGLIVAAVPAASRLVQKPVTVL